MDPTPVPEAPELVSLTLTFGSKAIEFYLSTDSDPYFEMFETLLSLSDKEMLEPEQKNWTLLWIGLDNGYQWNFQKVDDQNIEITLNQIDNLSEYLKRTDAEDNEEGWEAEYVEEMFNGLVATDDIILAILKRVDDYLKTFGFLQYSKQFNDNEFPVTSFLKLKNHLVEKAKWNDNPSEISDTFKNEIKQLVR